MSEQIQFPIPITELHVGQIITIPSGTELNTGTHEDSDHLTLIKDVRAIIFGPVKNGAVLVQLIDEKNNKIGDPIYFHQPVQ